jgi:uncharacterized protein (DUF302 family)
MRSIFSFLFIVFTVFSVKAGTMNNADDGLYFKKTLTGNFSEIVEKVRENLKNQGFSVITEIDMDKKLNEKLDTDVRPYKILGACNPGYAYKTLQIDDNIGVFLPCKVIVKQLEGNQVEVVSVNPAEMMRMMDNEELTKVAEEVSIKLKAVVEGL